MFGVLLLQGFLAFVTDEPAELAAVADGGPVGGLGGVGAVVAGHLQGCGLGGAGGFPEVPAVGGQGQRKGRLGGGDGAYQLAEIEVASRLRLVLQLAGQHETLGETRGQEDRHRARELRPQRIVGHPLPLFPELVLGGGGQAIVTQDVDRVVEGALGGEETGVPLVGGRRGLGVDRDRMLAGFSEGAESLDRR